MTAFEYGLLYGSLGGMLLAVLISFVTFLVVMCLL